VKKRQKARKGRKPEKPKRSPRRALPAQASPGEEDTAEVWEAETAHTLAAQERKWEDLPDSDGETKVVLLPVNPFLVHVYWEIAARDLEELGRTFKRLGPQVQSVLRFYATTQLDFDGMNPPTGFDVEIDLRAGNWYIHLESPVKSYCLDLGLRTAGGGFRRLARSNLAAIPPAGPSDDLAESYLLVEDHSGVEMGVAPSERADTVETLPRRPGVSLPTSEEESRTQGADLRISRPVGADVLPEEAAQGVKTPAEAIYPGERQSAEGKGPEADALKIFRTVATGEIERRVKEFYRRQGWERSGSTPTPLSAGEPQTSEKQRVDLTEVSEKSFRAGISSGRKSSVIAGQSSAA